MNSIEERERYHFGLLRWWRRCTVQGVSRREVKQIIEGLVDHVLSASVISAIKNRLDNFLKAFCDRKLNEPFPCLILAAQVNAAGGWDP